jgi:hypothetical protein
VLIQIYNRRRLNFPIRVPLDMKVNFDTIGNSRQRTKLSSRYCILGPIVLLIINKQYMFMGMAVVFVGVAVVFVGVAAVFVGMAAVFVGMAIFITQVVISHLLLSEVSFFTGTANAAPPSCKRPALARHGPAVLAYTLQLSFTESRICAHAHGLWIVTNSHHHSFRRFGFDE